MATQLSLLDAHFSPEEAAIMRLLRPGRANAISVKALEAETGITGRVIRQTVRNLIMDQGILIGSSVTAPFGYFVPETAAEAVTATKSMRRRGILILMRAAKFQRCSVELVFNQARLEFEEVEDERKDGSQRRQDQAAKGEQ